MNDENKRQSFKDVWANYEKDPEGNADKLVAYCENLRTSWVQNRRSEYDTQWTENMGFYRGQHNIRRQLPSSPYRANVKENHTNNSINRMLSIFVQNIPVTRVFSNSVQQEDLDDASTTEAWLKYCYRKHCLEQKYQKWIKYSLIFGNGFLFRGFDPNANGIIKADADETNDWTAKEVNWQGDIVVEVDDPFRIAVRPGIEELSDMFDIIRSVPTNRDMMEGQYGQIEADPARGFSMANQSVTFDPTVVLVNHYYHKPTPWFPEGAYVCWAGNKLVKAFKYPKRIKTLPFTHLPFDKAPMNFFGMAPIEQIMDLQEQLDRASSMIVEARNLMARPRVLVSQEAEVPGQSLSDRPGEIIRYKLQGGAPKFETPSFNFGEMASHKADLRSALNQVIGLTGASRGEIPATIRTALALQLVLEQDRSQFVPFIKTMHNGLVDLNYGICEIASQYITEDDPRVIKIEGQTGGRDFTGAMIPDPLDVYLEDANPLGWTAAGRIEQVGFLIDKGIITDRNQILEMLKMNSPDPASEVTRINRQTQEIECETLEKGKFVPIGPEDDDAIHLDVLNKVIASYSFRFKPKLVQEAILMHNEAHKQRFMQSTGGAGGAPAAPKAGGIPPEQMAMNAAAPNPGANLEMLLGKK